MINYYAVPAEPAGRGGTQAKYIRSQGITDFVSLPLGKEPWFVVRADTTSAQDSFIASQPDGFRIPQPLTNAIATTGVLNAVKNALEMMNIPGQWITVSNTFLDVLRGTAWLAQFLQILDGLGITQIFVGGVTLSSTFGSLPQTTQDAILTAATQMSLDTTGLSGSTTLRAIVTNMMTQFITRSINIEL